MKRLRIAEILKSTDVDVDITVKGWVRTKRGNKNVAFIALNDGRKIAGVEWMVRVVINMSDFKICGEDNTQFANLLHA